MKKKQLVLTLVTALMMVLLLASCGSGDTALEKHEIGYPGDYATVGDDYGADAYDGWCDNPDTQYFAINDYYNMESEGSLHILTNFETYQQTTEYTCGPASALMVLNWFGGDTEKYDEMTIADITETSDTTGVNPNGLGKFFEEIGWEYEVSASTDGYFDSLEAFEAWAIENIDNGVPMMVDWIDWCGHWQVIIGIDTMQEDVPSDDVLILADAYDTSDHYQDGYYTFSAERFFYMWQEGSVSEADSVFVHPFVVAQPAE